MNNLLFLSNELMNPAVQREMRLPLTFISYGLAKGKMYKHFRNQSTFVMPESNKSWGNSVVYGALFLCTDYDFYARILDAYHICSLSTMLRNHVQDVHHRVGIEVIPLYFEKLIDFAKLKYREGESITAQTYLGNPNHPKISQRLKESKYRVVDGIDAENFKQLFWEVNRETN